MKYIDRPSLGLCRVDMFIEPTANPAYSNKVHWETNVRRTCRKNNLTEHKPASLYSTQPIRATELQNEAPSPIPTTTQPTLPEVPLLLRFWKAAAALPRDAGICKHEWPAVLIIGSLLYWTLALCVCRESCKPKPPRIPTKSRTPQSHALPPTEVAGDENPCRSAEIAAAGGSSVCTEFQQGHLTIPTNSQGPHFS